MVYDERDHVGQGRRPEQANDSWTFIMITAAFMGLIIAYLTMCN